ncbi:amine oxidase [Caballeronia humi]|uniref:Amine oxidase n=2 Tax=Caballeronia humi TaxID=326474 RepID=A0A158IKM1_9BURK|nr:amine oxidase [Caballeronia humi]
MLRINRKKSAGRAQIVSPTVNNFKSLPVFYPDHPSVRWQNVALGQMLSATTLSGTLDVCVVGRGASALAAMTELNEIAVKNPGLIINVRNIYYDAEVEQAADSEINYGSKWGRIFSVKPGDNYQEIGCMRFPSIALLTWNYINKAYPTSGDVPLTRFPNPGRVPTQFLYRDMNVVFENGVALTDMNDADQIANFATMEAVKNGVINYLLTQVNASNGRNAGYFTQVLVGNPGEDPTILGMSDAQVRQVWLEWNTFIAEFDTPLIDKVQDAIDALILSGTIQTTALRDRDYFVELFGRYGFGTGGFRALNNVTFNEIARLLIWNYSDEYLFPGNAGDSATTNTDFAARLLSGLTDIQLTQVVQKALFIGRRVSDSRLTVVGYDTVSGGIVESSHDYVILATSHHAAQRVVEPFAGMQASEAIAVETPLYFEVNGALHTYVTSEGFQHPFDLQRGGSGSLYGALKNLHMMRSTKYFTDVPTAQFNAYAPSNGDQTKRVKMVISDTDLAASYCLDGQNGTTNLLVSYTWGDEATNEAPRLRGLTAYAGSASDAALRYSHAQASNRFAQASGSNQVAGFWMASLLSEVAPGTGYMYDWSSDQDSRGGFKLDWASETPFSTALYDHYRNSVLGAEATQQPQQRMFVAGDSFSHYGGWLEGAFMTGITAVAGIMRSAYTDAVFSDEGKRLFMTPTSA